MCFMAERSVLRTVSSVTPLHERCHGMGANVITILQMRTLRLIEFRALAHVHTPVTWQSWE